MITLAALLLVAAACGQRRFERVIKTDSRYDIVYLDVKCGVFDTRADSLVTKCDYDALSFLKRGGGLRGCRAVQLQEGWHGRDARSAGAEQRDHAGDVSGSSG